MNSSKEQLSLELSQDIKNNLDYFIEPIKPKVFEFSENFDTQKTIDRLHQARMPRYRNFGWKPSLHNKKLNQDPKFILSLQRKKARIISGIRDKQIDSNYHNQGIMHGSKVKFGHRSFYNKKENENSPRKQYQMKHTESKQRQKKKKNPHMNFSLRYITEEKKKLMKDKGQTANLSSAREKGSNVPYMNLFFAQNMKIKSVSRPKTTRTYRKTETQNKIRTHSVIFN